LRILRFFFFFISRRFSQ